MFTSKVNISEHDAYFRGEHHRQNKRSLNPICLNNYLWAKASWQINLNRERLSFFKYITLDDIEIRNYVLTDPKGFLKYFSTPLVIDEIQKDPSLLEYIKKEIDEMKKKALLDNEPIKLLYILSGSNQFELQQAVTESLSGRTCVFNLSSFFLQRDKGKREPFFFQCGD